MMNKKDVTIFVLRLMRMPVQYKSSVAVNSSEHTNVTNPFTLVGAQLNSLIEDIHTELEEKI